MADAFSRRLRSTLWAGGAVLLIGSLGATCGSGVRPADEVPHVEEVGRGRPAAGAPTHRVTGSAGSLPVVPGRGDEDERAVGATAATAREAAR